MERIAVDLVRNGYDIYIGRGLQEELKSFFRKNDFSHQAMLVTDSNVGPLYGERVKKVLAEAGVTLHICTLPAGERTKTLSMIGELCSKAIEFGLDRYSPVIACGGGVIGDLAGFFAATYMRGVPFIQIPTSLLAQVDSSVGGKTGVNHYAGKNLLGAFYQPKAVFIDIDFLQSLPPREVSTGLGEIVKYGVISDASFFSFLEEHYSQLLQLEPETVLKTVKRACQLKAEIVEADEKEKGLRRILNFGHTIGHAIEKETRFSRYNHGEAVAIGMAAAAELSRGMGLTEKSYVNRLVVLLKKMGLPFKAEGCIADNIFADIFHDKKVVDGRVNWVLIKNIGDVVIRNDVPAEMVQHVIEECLED